jgi:hypothetical protein
MTQDGADKSGLCRERRWVGTSITVAAALMVFGLLNAPQTRAKSSKRAGWRSSASYPCRSQYRRVSLCASLEDARPKT